MLAKGSMPVLLVSSTFNWIVDVLAHRTRLSFLNAYAALDALPRVIEIMKEELGWNEARCTQEYDQTVVFLKTMGLVMKGEKKPEIAGGAGMLKNVLIQSVAYWRSSNVLLPKSLFTIRARSTKTRLSQIRYRETRGNQTR
jgi:hypothetical protein